MEIMYRGMYNQWEKSPSSGDMWERVQGQLEENCCSGNIYILRAAIMGETETVFQYCRQKAREEAPLSVDV